MKKLLLILLCLPLLYSCNSGWSFDETITFMSECESTDLEGVNSELQEELCWCMLQEAKKTYPKGPPNSKDWDTLWAKEAGEKCLLDIPIQKTLKDSVFWTPIEKGKALRECVKSVYDAFPLSIESNVNEYCSCCLEKTMLKYDRPTNDMDAEWLAKVSKECFSKHQSQDNAVDLSSKELYSESNLMQLKVSANKNPAIVGEQILIQYTINEKAETFQSPNFNGLRVLSGPNPSTQSNYRFVNGESVNGTSTTNSFYVKALNSGNYTISTASIFVKGKKIISKEYRLNIMD